MTALACSKILKELAKEEEDTDTTDDMLALAEQYEQKAIGEQEWDQQLSTALTPCGAGWLCPGGVWGCWVAWMVPNGDPLLTVGVVVRRGLCLGGGGSAEGAAAWCDVQLLLRRVILRAPC